MQAGQQPARSRRLDNNARSDDRAQLGWTTSHQGDLLLRSSKAVYISAWQDRRPGKEKTVPKLLRARAPEDAVEERKVRKLARSRHAPADWINRARMITLSWDGLRTTQIASELRCHPQTVRERIHRFNAEGLDGLGDRPGAGRKPRITEAERSLLIGRWTPSPPPPESGGLQSGEARCGASCWPKG